MPQTVLTKTTQCEPKNFKKRFPQNARVEKRPAIKKQKTYPF